MKNTLLVLLTLTMTALIGCDIDNTCGNTKPIQILTKNDSVSVFVPIIPNKQLSLRFSYQSYSANSDTLPYSVILDSNLLDTVKIHIKGSYPYYPKYTNVFNSKLHNDTLDSWFYYDTPNDLKSILKLSSQNNILCSPAIPLYQLEYLVLKFSPKRIVTVVSRNLQ
ncbi:MAG: hypothetical protein JNJ85_03470 [Candidatus Kapabacteria bacterium]|nr:hypothetical protein [Candidatus Kapabacteria bacterium]